MRSTTTGSRGRIRNRPRPSADRSGSAGATMPTIPRGRSPARSTLRARRRPPVLRHDRSRTRAKRRWQRPRPLHRRCSRARGVAAPGLRRAREVRGAPRSWRARWVHPRAYPSGRQARGAARCDASRWARSTASASALRPSRFELGEAIDRPLVRDQLDEDRIGRRADRLQSLEVLQVRRERAPEARRKSCHGCVASALRELDAVGSRRVVGAGIDPRRLGQGVQTAPRSAPPRHAVPPAARAARGRPRCRPWRRRARPRAPRPGRPRSAGRRTRSSPPHPS